MDGDIRPQGESGPGSQVPGQDRPPSSSKKGKGVKGKPAPRVVAPPKTAAVTMTIEEGSSATYEGAMREVRKNGNLSDLGIGGLRWKRAITGGLIIEVPGEEGAQKADRLAAKMVEILGGTGVRVSRPSKKAEFRLTGMDISGSSREVVEAVAAAGGCPPEAVKTGEIRIPDAGMATIWVQCPAAAARKIEKAGAVEVGWSTARVAVLAVRLLQCFRCLAIGHVRQRCTSTVDRSGCCCKRGSPAHLAAQCREAPHCAVCATLGRPAGHQAGSKACPPPSRPRRNPEKPSRRGGGDYPNR